MPKRDLRDQVIAITGGGTGIGAATALACAAAGMNVAINGRRRDKLDEVAKRIEALGRRALVVVGDVVKPSDVEAFIHQTHQTFGRLDAVFANAGYGLFRTVLETSDEEMRAIFETNFYGTLHTIKAAVPVLKQHGGGRVLICSSAASKIGPPMYGAYAATKASQAMITSALRAELLGTGIQVTSIHPIGTRTDFFQGVSKASGLESRPKSNTPDRFRQTVEHVANTIVKNLRQTNPAPEVWPSFWSKIGLAIVCACPRLGAWGLKRHRDRLKPE